MAYQPYDTAAEIVSAAARELSLVTADIADPFGSPDPNILLLCSLLTRVGRRIMRAHQWPFLVTTATISVAASATASALPSDFDRVVDNAFWDRTNRMPVAPLSRPILEELRAANFVSMTTPGYWIEAGEIEYEPAWAGAAELGFGYVSSNWVNANTDKSTAAADIIYLDVDAVVAGLKVAFLRAKGLDSSAAADEYRDALNAAKAASGPAPVLSLSPPDVGIADPVIPLSGFGL